MLSCLSCRWSIILPLSWVKAFWIPLVSNGAHAIGLREKQWIASDVSICTTYTTANASFFCFCIYYLVLNITLKLFSLSRRGYHFSLKISRIARHTHASWQLKLLNVIKRKNFVLLL